MNYKKVIEEAKEILLKYSSDRVADNEVFLEELIPLDKGGCKVTLGFYERNKRANEVPPALANIQGEYRKIYKVLFFDEEGNFEGLENYD